MTSRNANKIASAIRRSIKRGRLDYAAVSGVAFAEVFDHLRAVSPDCQIGSGLEAFCPVQGWHIQVLCD